MSGGASHPVRNEAEELALPVRLARSARKTRISLKIEQTVFEGAFLPSTILRCTLSFLSNADPILYMSDADDCISTSTKK